MSEIKTVWVAQYDAGVADYIAVALTKHEARTRVQKRMRRDGFGDFARDVYTCEMPLDGPAIDWGRGL